MIVFVDKQQYLEIMTYALAIFSLSLVAYGVSRAVRRLLNRRRR